MTRAPHDRPMAATGLTSYRARGPYGWIMIGARDDVDAMREARRGTNAPTDLQVWHGGRYVPCAAAGGHWDMTLADALARQAAQIEHYGPRFPGGVEALRARVGSVTDTAGCDLNAMLSMSEVNRRVPRGVHIENICGISWREYD